MRRALAPVASLLVALAGGACRTPSPQRAAAPAEVSPMPPRAQRALESGCKLFRDGSETATSADCAGCHRSYGPAAAVHRNHPGDVDYARAHASAPSLRAADEVVKRGVFLPGGQVRCVTCHDRRSPWDAALALPPGATPRAGVDPRDPRTYDDAATGGPPGPGARVSAKPLCVACHELD